MILVTIMSITVQEKIEVLNERLERECYGSGERSLPPGDFTDYSSEAKNLSKQKCECSYLIAATAINLLINN